MFPHQLRQSALYLAAAALVLGLAACSEDADTGSNPGPSAPALPRFSTMTMDLSFFGVGSAGASSFASRDPDELRRTAGNKRNWIEAAVRVFYAQLLFYDAFEEPVAAFAAAIHSVPQQQADGSWLWTYIFVDGGVDYGVFLYGKVVGDHVDWRMEVSSSDPAHNLDHFVWFDGESQRDESRGYWQFYKPVLTPPASVRLYMTSMTEGAPVARVAWDHHAPNDHGVVVTVNEEGSPDEGDILAFRTWPTRTTLAFHDEIVQQDHNVTWYIDGSGFLIVPGYNAGEKACWDARQEDVVCP